MPLPEIWVLVLMCNCVQPLQPLYGSYEKCAEQGRRELYTLNINVPAYRCLQVPR